ncbi:c-type cytochrome [Neolewinella sp.]|uniref:c-type cytochrome n=1 Tax=Neolewinella sp. TaxID=2993543 RepID=UPI003B520DD8
MESKQGVRQYTITTVPAVACLLCLCWALNGCSTPSRVPAATVVNLPTEELRDGSILFAGKCSGCHPGGRSGLGPSIVNKPLPRALIRFQTRAGLGVMPAFKDHVLSDDQVKDIASYLVYLRKKG